ncbi:MAG: hypothetical protein JSU00_04925 [Acidobacteria bacterium]|nr:hypothetical protein [Acidobacteriota bacterium]
MSARWILALTSWLAAAQGPGPLEQTARTASVMVDGDVCLRIETARSKSFATMKDPRDPWRNADNYDVDDEAFIRTKKTLMRLAKLCDSACDVNLWMPLASDPGRIQVVIRNVHEMSQFWPWGALNQEMPPEMKAVLTNGQRMTVRKKPGMISVLAPVYDSLGDIVGLVEVVSQTKPDPRENVK